MRSISASLMAGMIGATITDVGTPACESSGSASRRRAGAGARGAMIRAGACAAGRIDRHRGRERGQVFKILRAVVGCDSGKRLVASRSVGVRAAAAAAIRLDRDGGVGGRIEIDGR